MSPIRKPDDWVRQFLTDPYDAGILREVRAATGSNDADAYAALLERAAAVLPDDSAASHVLTEAALAHLQGGGDPAGKAVSLLRRALERDPLNARAAGTLTSVYRARNDHAAIGAMLETRAHAFEHLAARDPGLLPHASEAYEALARHYVECLEDRDAAITALQKALALVRRFVQHVDPSPPFPSTETGAPKESRARLRGAFESELVPAADDRSTETREPSYDEEPTDPYAQSRSFAPPATDPQSLRPSDPRSLTLRPSFSPAPIGAFHEDEDRLMGLFEALHAVRCCNDAREGAALVVQIVRDALEAESAILHLYDASTREYVVAAALGCHERTLVGERCSDADPLLARATAAAQAVLASPVADHGLFTGQRWSIVGAKRSAVCAPVLDDAGILGALEILDPKTRPEFDEHDRDAMTYVGERFAEFLSERGFPLD